jgi:hypothetical protein
MAGPNRDSDERARRLRERFAGSTKEAGLAPPPKARMDERRVKLLIALFVIVGLVAYAAWKVSQGDAIPAGPSELQTK